ncbi:hypothetical protein AB6D11_00980 [Vibrio splendidus]
MTQVTFSTTIQTAATESNAHLFGSHGNASIHLLNLDERRFDHQYIRSGGHWLIAIRTDCPQIRKRAKDFGYYIVEHDNDT